MPGPVPMDEPCPSSAAASAWALAAAEPALPGLQALRRCALCQHPVVLTAQPDARCPACHSPLAALPGHDSDAHELLGRRGSVRRDQSHVALIHVGWPSPAVAVRWRDLSLTGLSLYVPQPVAAGRRLRLIDSAIDERIRQNRGRGDTINLLSDAFLGGLKWGTVSSEGELSAEAFGRHSELLTQVGGLDAVGVLYLFYVLESKAVEWIRSLGALAQTTNPKRVGEQCPHIPEGLILNADMALKGIEFWGAIPSTELRRRLGLVYGMAVKDEEFNPREYFFNVKPKKQRRRGSNRRSYN